MKKILIVILIPTFTLNAMHREIKIIQHPEVIEKATILLNEINAALDNNDKTEKLRELHEKIPGTLFPALKQLWREDRPIIHAETKIQTILESEKSKALIVTEYENKLLNAKNNFEYISAVETDYSLDPSHADDDLFPVSG
jgi:hypothetical protein